MGDVFHEKTWQLISRGGHFYHFRVSFCVMRNAFNFIEIKKQEHRGTVQKVLYSPMSSFLKIDGVISSVRVTHFPSLRLPHCCFWWLLDKKCSLQKYLMYQCLLFGKNLARPLFIFNVMFVFGYYKEFTLVLSQKNCQLFYKDNWVNQRIYHTINER